MPEMPHVRHPAGGLRRAAEYAHVPDGGFRAGRSRVMQELLKLPSIHRLAPIRDAWEARAQANLGSLA